MGRDKDVAVVSPKHLERGDGGDDDDDEFALSEKEEVNDVLPVQKRHCTDVVCLMLFLAYLAGMVGVSIVGFSSGDPERLIRGYNHEGKLCGGEELPNKGFVSYPRIEEDILLSGALDLSSPFDLNNVLPDIEFFGVCVASCPEAGDFVCTEAGQAAADAAVTSSGKTEFEVKNDCINNYFATIIPGDDCEDEEIRKGCFQAPFDTVPIFTRCLPRYFYEVEVLPESGCTRFRNFTTSNGVESICTVYKEVTKVTKEQPTASNFLFDTFNTYARLAESLIGDIVKARQPIFASGVGVSFFVGLCYIMALWCCVRVLVWTSVIGTLLAAVCFTLYCYIKAGIISGELITTVYGSATALLEEATDAVSDNIEGLLNLGNDTISFQASNTTSLPAFFEASLDYTTEYTYTSYVATAVTLILLIIIFGLFERIVRATEIFEEASKAIRKNLFITLVPFVSMFFMAAVVALWSYSTAYVASAGSFSIKAFNQSVSINPTDVATEVAVFGAVDYQTFMVAYMFFGLLWILNFISGITVMTISGAVLQWFWNTEVAEDSTNRRRFRVVHSFYLTIRYHLGSVALGSLILAFIQFIRYLAAYLQRKMQSAEKNNKMFKIIFCCVHCFLRCVQKFIEFITRNGYIYVALYGDNFCVATKNAFVASVSNIAQVAMVSFLGDLILRFGQLMISIFAGVFVWIWLDSDPQYQFGGENDIYSYVWVVSITMILAWFTAAEVLAAFDITVDTILMSYIQDKRLSEYKAHHKGKSSESLHAFMDKHSLKDPKLIKQASMTSVF